ncbi:MAG: polysaccharide deacetylase family protein, partial [Myxococcota bacterium]
PGRLTRLVLEADRAGAALAQEPALAFLHRVATGTLGTSQPELDRLVMDAKALGDVELHEEVSHAAEVLGVEVEPRSPVILDWEQVEKMGASGWIRFGSHGRSHQRLCSPLDHDTQRLEVESSRAALREKVTAYSDVFCYPNGDSSPEAEEEVRRSYLGACVGAKGWNQRGDDPFRLRRILIHQDVTSNEDAFLARLSGVL